MPAKPLSAADLPWLPRWSGDLRAQLAAVESGAVADAGLSLRSLATHYLSLSQATAVAQTLERLRPRGAVPSLQPFRLGLVSNATIELLKPLLVASALRYGLALEIIAGEFGQVAQQALDPDSLINRARPDAVLIAVNHEGLPFRTAPRGAWPLFDAAAAARELDAVRSGFRRHSGATCLVQSIPAPPQPLFGSLDTAVAGTLRAELAAFNTWLAREANAQGDLLIDIDWLAQCVGLAEWHDQRQWHMARLPCSLRALALYADAVARAVGALRGKSRKCLILDLDNVLWGGVIGDDGLDGISLNVGDARGEAHRAVQEAAADLRSRGIVLAVCSKNDDATARLPFRQHPGMVLRETDIAVFVANWDDKASNIERIAQQLELGLDAMVLLDDNPVERAQVRAELPLVAVPELGNDPSTYATVLLSAGYFESSAFTPEDLSRADHYQGNAGRAQALEGARNLEDFLKSLEMTIRFAPFDARGRKRITQLINKTNQFNVTTRRYSEQQVADLEASSGHYTLQVSVADRFADNGMISVVICTTSAAEWEIDTWLMSCRVLNRGVEQAVCNRVAGDARAAGARRLIGRFIPTERNGIVRDLFARLGFVRAADAPDGERWLLELENFVPHEVFFAQESATAPGAAR